VDAQVRTFESLDELRAAAGEHLGDSDWLTVDQARVDAFAEATGDHQWIHVDVSRARRDSPCGGTIAHGFLTLSLIAAVIDQVISVPGCSYAVNYGCNRVRFPASVPVGSRVRASASLASAEDVPGGLQVVTAWTFTVEGAAKPCCVAETVTRYYS
jgi:acyl dehydratase